MKLQYASDLHLEFPENKAYLRTKPIKPEGDILILAGDILPVVLIPNHTDFFDYLSDNFMLTYWLPGNHEYYHSDISELGKSLNEQIKDNVFLVNNTSLQSGEISLIFSTLWTRISPQYKFQMLLSYSDFQAILYKGRSLSIEHYNHMHYLCRQFLTDELAVEKPVKKIVITHHMPTFQNYPEEYKGSPLNEAFAVELSDLILSARPDYWIFGHNHNNKGDFKIGDTLLITNQLGYVMYNEHKRYNEGKIIEV